MEAGLKQRLVGALVLVALGVLFLPVLFDRDERLIDKKSQIPPSPEFVPWEDIGLPSSSSKSELAPEPDTMFTPVDGEQQVVDILDGASENFLDTVSDRTPLTASEITPEATHETTHETALESNSTPPAGTKTSVPDPKAVFTEQGLPRGWLVQVASFTDLPKAVALTEKLSELGYKAYSHTLETTKGKVTRVYVGPSIDKSSALQLKQQLDSLLTLNALVVEM